MDMYIDDVDPAFEKLLSDNRDRYIRQSSNTRCGQVAPLPERNKNVDKPNCPKPHAWLFRDRPVLEFSAASRSA
jgi:hypothetical protein